MPKMGNFRTVKTLPYMMAVMLTFCILAMILSRLVDVSGGIFLTVEFLEYLAVLAVYVCVYRLADDFKMFVAADVMFVSFVLSSLANKIIVWVGQFEGIDNNLLILPIYILSLAPDIFIMLGVAFIIKGLSDKYKEMGMEEKVPGMDKCLRVWITSQVLVVVIGDVLLPIYRLIYDDILWAMIFMLVVIGLFYIAAVLQTCYCTIRFCYDYYMYMYNGPKKTRG